MNPIETEFGKLELGTKFYDPSTKDHYRKVSETEAEPEDETRYSRRVEWNVPVNDSFHPNETVIVQ